jgi:hypothetical protein
MRSPRVDGTDEALAYGRGLTPEAVSALATRQNSRIKNAGL